MSSAPRLEIRGLCKRYAAPVLDRFDWEVAPGEVHALMGANGAGKSTLARIVAGLAQPDAGAMSLDGVAHSPTSKRAAEHAGVVIVLQELNILPTLTIAENLFLDRLPRRWGWVAWRELRRRAQAALERVGLNDVDPEMRAGDLGVGHRQSVEIAAALDRDCRLLILDEPTAALTETESRRLFENVRRLCGQGVSVVYVSHRMDEIQQIAARATVMRDGRRIVTVDPRRHSSDEFVTWMTDEKPNANSSIAVNRKGPVQLRVEGLRAGERVRDVSWEVRRGEILGIAGLVGSGRTEMLRAIFGADRLDGGTLQLGPEGRVVRFRSPRDAMRAGVGMVSEDRKEQGLLLTESIRANATLSVVERHATAGWIDARGERCAAEHVVESLDVKCEDLEQPAVELSGGNQQKVLLGRWLLRDVDVLLLDEPTRGVDAGAKAAIHDRLRKLAAAGKALVVVSSELSELQGLCDRIVVLASGRVVAEFARDEFDAERILKAAFTGWMT